VFPVVEVWPFQIVAQDRRGATGTDSTLGQKRNCLTLLGGRPVGDASPASATQVGVNSSSFALPVTGSD
jgi:hypothetical protein